MGSQAGTGVEPVAGHTNYRWFILVIVCLGQMITWMDRANIGVVIPALKAEFRISNFEAGSLAGIYFVGYALIQIPAGFLISRYGMRGFISATMVAYSSCTALIGTASSAFLIKTYRLLLGITEAPVPVGVNGIIKNWFPSKERGIALGIFTGSSSTAVLLAAPAAVWIMVHHGWRSVFYWFAAPGVVMAVIWYAFVRRTPADSPHANAAERELIGAGSQGRHVFDGSKKIVGSLGWLDRLIRLRTIPQIESNAKVFTSKNILGIAVVYCFVHGINYGLMTWVPSYLITVRHLTAMKMGWTSSAPWLGGLFGTLCGGAISDRLLLGRRKPMIMFTGLSTLAMMWVVVHAPNSPIILPVILFMTGFCLFLAFPSLFAYPMGITTAKTYPVAVSVMITGGNIGSFLAPMTAGYLLDRTKSYDVVFLFLGLCALIAFVLISMLEEPSA
jgi:sugar phosphate permease